jgi:GMP synthase (glutamine-hydrolysing)
VDWNAFIGRAVSGIRAVVGQGTAISALSGGVDSSATTVLGSRALGERLKSFFIDTGVMREGEGESVREDFQALGIRVELVDASDEFFADLKGLTDPEEKRKAFRKTFYTVLGQLVKRSGAGSLLQGTIAADIKETQAGVKTQHNVLEQIGIDPEGFGFKMVEPLRELYKHQVRDLARALGLPERRCRSMPFPGPGLATRVVGEVTPERVAMVRRAGKIVEEELQELSPFQCFAVLLSDRATGLHRGRRAFGNIVAIRSVESEDALTASVSQIPWPKLKRLQERITAEIPAVVKVLYDLSPKPPSTIEWV